MDIIQKTFELQIDEKSNGYVIRLNDEEGCVLRICKIPDHLIVKKNGKFKFIDIEYKK